MVKVTQLSIFAKYLYYQLTFHTLGTFLIFFSRQNKHAYCLNKQQADFYNSSRCCPNIMCTKITRGDGSSLFDT